MVTLLLGSALALSGWAAPRKPPPKQPLALQVLPEPAVAVEGQPISLQLRWVNRSTASLRVNHRCLLGREVLITVRIKGKKPVALVTPPDLGPPVETDFRSLAPGERFEYEYPLTPKSGEGLPPGRYDIRVTYRNDVPGPTDPPAWTGRVHARASVRVRRMVK